jgi:hypothetical protein
MTRHRRRPPSDQRQIQTQDMAKGGREGDGEASQLNRAVWSFFVFASLIRPFANPISIPARLPIRSADGWPLC